MRSKYDYSIRGKFLLITGLDQGKSVTNDMKSVLKDIQGAEKNDLKDYVILYRDFCGIISQIILKDNIEFISLNEKSFMAAIKNCRYKL